MHLLWVECELVCCWLLCGNLVCRGSNGALVFCRRNPVAQTKAVGEKAEKHWKIQVKGFLKRNSPDSCTSTADAVPGAAPAARRPPGTPVPAEPDINALIQAGENLNLARARLLRVAEAAGGIAVEGPRAREDLRRFHKYLMDVPDTALATRARKIWSVVSACGGEFGAGFSSAVKALQLANEEIGLLLPKAAKEAAKDKAPALAPAKALAQVRSGKGSS